VRPAAETDAGDFVASHDSAPALGDWLLSRPLARGIGPRFSAPLDLVVLDDDLEGKYPPSTRSDILERGASESAVASGPGWQQDRVVFAEPRASKGAPAWDQGEASAPHDRSRARLVIVFGHPRLIDEIPEGPPVLLAWHRQGLMQEPRRDGSGNDSPDATPASRPDR
jgi:hypothetical protein